MVEFDDASAKVTLVQAGVKAIGKVMQETFGDEPDRAIVLATLSILVARVLDLTDEKTTGFMFSVNANRAKKGRAEG